MRTSLRLCIGKGMFRLSSKNILFGPVSFNVCLCRCTHYQHYLPLFPLAIRSFAFHDYDLVISSSHCVAKGLRVPDNVCHVAYIHTPMRYIWDQFDAYFADGRAGWLTRTVMGLLRRPLQRWDVSSNDGVHRFVANSEHVARRIRSYWGREATVLYPPVDWQSFAASNQDEGFYLLVIGIGPLQESGSCH